jgi:hypothetical protein
MLYRPCLGVGSMYRQFNDNLPARLLSTGTLRPSDMGPYDMRSYDTGAQYA